MDSWQKMTTGCASTALRPHPQERPLSPGAIPRLASPPSATPPGSPHSQLDPQDVFDALDDGLAMELDDHAFSEPSSDGDHFYVPDYACDADSLRDNPAGHDEDPGALRMILAFVRSSCCPMISY